MHSNQHHSAPVLPNHDITSVRLSEDDAIKVIAKDSTVIIFGDGRIVVDSGCQIDMAVNKLTISSEEGAVETHSS